MLFAACTTDVTEDVAVKLPETITVSFEEGSRIQLNEGKTVWTAGDLVSVFYRSDANQQWKFQGVTGDRSGNLRRVSTPEATTKLSKVVAVYPYNKNYYINPETCNIEATLPAEQTYLKDSYGLDGNILVSASEFNQLYMRNVLGWLKIQLKGEGQVVKKITLKGNNSEQVAGLIYIDSSDATATLAAEHSDGGDDGVGGTLVFEDTILTEVALNCTEGVTLGSEATAFYIALPPQEFSKGFTLKVLYDDDTTMTKSTSNSVTIERNTILPMDALYYDGNTPPVYELAYTTNNSQPLDPYTTEGFGANFLENIYDAETGKGSLKFDGRITTIPANAFIVCTNLTWIDIPNCITTIGDKAFKGCSAVESLTLPSSITSIGKSAFENCTGKVTINSNGKFHKAKFTEVVIGNSVTAIGNYAFEDCSSLTSVTIPDSVTMIGSYAFKNCSSLASVTIGNRVTMIGEYAFYSCSNIKDVYYQGDLSGWCKISFRDNPLSYGAKLYIDNKEVTDITIPSDIISIGDYAFLYCSSLTSVTISDSVTEIGSQAFYGCSSLTSVTIGNRVTMIGYYAFSGCSSLTSVTIPNRVTEIGDGAFYNCSSLTSVTIGNNVTTLGTNPFKDCSKLTEFNGKFASADKRCLIVDGVLNSFAIGCGLTEYAIPNSVTEIGDWAFYNCSNLTSVTIPNSVTEIGDWAFLYCSSLTSVTIPDSVTEIGRESFHNCTNLKEVFCKPITPPTGASWMFDTNATDRKIYVPASDDDSIINAYKAADYWKNYADYIEEYEFTE